MVQSDYAITSLIGRGLYTANGISIGIVEDIVLDFDHGFAKKLAVTDINPELFISEMDVDQGILIPYRWIGVVDDIIITSNCIGEQKLKQL